MVTDTANVAARPELAAPAPRPRVLVVEDNRALQRVVVQGLGSLCETIACDDAESGLVEALREPPDLLIVDIGLPGMDGEELIRTVHGEPSLRRVAILAMTGSADSAQCVRLLEHGAQDFVRKPFVIAELRARVNNLVATKRTRDVLVSIIGSQEADLLALAGEVSRQQRSLRAALEQLEEARAAAEAAGRIKTDFLRMVSHELKTPITSMQLDLGLFAEDAAVRAHTSAHRRVARIDRSLRRLLQLVDTMLEWARVVSDRRTLNPTQVDVARLVRDVTDDLERFARTRGLSLRVTAPETPAAACTDERLLRVTLVNLILRAIQLTEHGEVDVELTSDAEGWTFQVSDGGPRLDDETLERMLAPFTGDGDGSIRGPGSGLDLHVIDDLARAVGGGLRLQAGSGPCNVLCLSVPDELPAPPAAPDPRVVAP